MNLKATLSQTAQSIFKADKNISVMIPRFDTRRIHQWRVDVKKIRSLVRMAQDAPASPIKLRLPAAINKVYRLLGEIRDGQLVRASIMTIERTDFPDLRDQFLTGVNRVILIQESAFKKLTRHWKEHHRQARRFNRRLSHFLTAAAVRHSVTFRLNELEVLASVPAVSDEQIHRIRSVVKDLLFNWSLLQRYKIAGLLTDDVQKIFQNIALLTGQYLDLTLSIRRLENFMKTDAGVTGSGESPDFLQSWQSEACGVRQEILAFLPQLRQIFLPVTSVETGKEKPENVYRRAVKVSL